MESQGSAAPNPETEVAVYAKMTNASGLSEATHVEHHEQLDGPSVDGGRFRCRKTTVGDSVTYVLTMKVKSKEKAWGGVNASTEFNLDVDEQFYNAFKFLSKKRLNKTRYVFHGKETLVSDAESNDTPLPPVKYEVDVFHKEDGTQSQWVKIDVELDDLITKLKESGRSVDGTTLTLKVSHLPIKPVGGFTNESATPEQKELLSNLWDNEFNLPVFEGQS